MYGGAPATNTDAYRPPTMGMGWGAIHQQPPPMAPPQPPPPIHHSYQAPPPPPPYQQAPPPPPSQYHEQPAPPRQNKPQLGTAASQIKKFYCAICNIRFTEQQHYNVHMEGVLHKRNREKMGQGQRTTGDPFKCKACGDLAFDTSPEWLAHIESRPHCENVLKLYYSMGAKAFFAAHGDLAFSPKLDNQCSEVERSDLDTLMRIRSGLLNNFMCKLCVSKLTTKANWTEHVTGRKHNRRCIDTKNKLGAEQYLEQYGDVPQNQPADQKQDLPKPNIQQHYPVPNPTPTQQQAQEFFCECCNERVTSDAAWLAHLNSLTHCRVLLSLYFSLGKDEYLKRYANVPFSPNIDSQCIRRDRVDLDEHMRIRSALLHEFKCTLCGTKCNMRPNWIEHLGGKKHSKKFIEMIKTMGYESYTKIYGDMPRPHGTKLVAIVNQLADDVEKNKDHALQIDTLNGAINILKEASQLPAEFALAARPAPEQQPITNQWPNPNNTLATPGYPGNVMAAPGQQLQPGMMLQAMTGPTIVQAQPMQYVVSSAQGGVPFAGQRPPFMTQMAPAGGMLPGPLPTQQIVLGQQIMSQQQEAPRSRIPTSISVPPSNNPEFLKAQLKRQLLGIPPSNEAEVYDYSHTPSGQGKQDGQRSKPGGPPKQDLSGLGVSNQGPHDKMARYPGQSNLPGGNILESSLESIQRAPPGAGEGGDRFLNPQNKAVTHSSQQPPLKGFPPTIDDKREMIRDGRYRSPDIDDRYAYSPPRPKADRYSSPGPRGDRSGGPIRNESHYRHPDDKSRRPPRDDSRDRAMNRKPEGSSHPEETRRSQRMSPGRHNDRSPRRRQSRSPGRRRSRSPRDRTSRDRDRRQRSGDRRREGDRDPREERKSMERARPLRRSNSRDRDRARTNREHPIKPCRQSTRDRSRSRDRERRRDGPVRERKQSRERSRSRQRSSRDRSRHDERRSLSRDRRPLSRDRRPLSRDRSERSFRDAEDAAKRHGENIHSAAAANPDWDRSRGADDWRAPPDDLRHPRPLSPHPSDEHRPFEKAYHERRGDDVIYEEPPNLERGRRPHDYMDEERFEHARRHGSDLDRDDRRPDEDERFHHRHHHDDDKYDKPRDLREVLQHHDLRYQLEANREEREVYLEPEEEALVVQVPNEDSDYRRVTVPGEDEDLRMHILRSREERLSHDDRDMRTHRSSRDFVDRDMRPDDRDMRRPRLDDDSDMRLAYDEGRSDIDSRRRYHGDQDFHDDRRGGAHLEERRDRRRRSNDDSSAFGEAAMRSKTGQLDEEVKVGFIQKETKRQKREEGVAEEIDQFCETLQKFITMLYNPQARRRDGLEEDVLDTLSPEEEQMVAQISAMTGVHDTRMAAQAVRVLGGLDPAIVAALSELSPPVVQELARGNYKAVKDVLAFNPLLDGVQSGRISLEHFTSTLDQHGFIYDDQWRPDDDADRARHDPSRARHDHDRGRHDPSRARHDSDRARHDSRHDDRARHDSRHDDRRRHDDGRARHDRREHEDRARHDIGARDRRDERDDFRDRRGGSRDRDRRGERRPDSRDRRDDRGRPR